MTPAVLWYILYCIRSYSLTGNVIVLNRLLALPQLRGHVYVLDRALDTLFRTAHLLF